ncbi:molybdopterin molybdotransferase MoeA [Halomonas organivorans]|uniref:Molybdopterin molybdenumtransferase n=1 Tax=Halomonas organivorans TaxID=257772 RepID=A0A7W5BZU8_9GAMM|nr:gephyrin-like molybdotransferase Glp [Halomonas organivorans]MBB3142036.1 molybdopterin molybdotransferase [Halomonas organivorans]
MTLSCFDLGEHMLTPDEARQALAELVAGVLPAERLPLVDLHGRVLAEEVISPIDVPQNTNAAMDGIALAWPQRDEPPARWRLVGEVLAGHRCEVPLAPGECMAITTGAPLPPGADTVIMREQLHETAAEVSVDRPEVVRHGQHVRQAGEDIARGQRALAVGHRLGAAELGLLASLGLAHAVVFRRPRVAIFSTGDEVTAPGEPLPAAGIYDANRFSLHGLLVEHGADVIDLGILSDDPTAVVAALDDAARCADLVLTSGGVSVGQADYTRQALETVGQLAFWRIAIRPGRPLACGVLGARRVPFLGLPGNPVAVMVTFLQFVAPLLTRLQGRTDLEPVRQYALADAPLRSRPGRTDYLRGVLRSDDQGRRWVRPTGAQGSGILSSMVAADCLIELDAACGSVEPGEAVVIQPLFRLS